MIGIKNTIHLHLVFTFHALLFGGPLIIGRLFLILAG